MNKTSLTTLLFIFLFSHAQAQVAASTIETAPDNDFNATGLANTTFIGTVGRDPYVLNAPVSSVGWWSVINVSHRNGAGTGPFSGTQFAVGLTDHYNRMFFRGQVTNNWQPWVEVATQGMPALGIGTATPTSKFEVNTTAGEPSGLRIHQVNTNSNPVNEPTTQILYDWYGLPKASINFHRGSAAIDGFISFSTAANITPVERMRIDQNGSVSIGTTSSYGYLLSVAGGVIAEKMKIKQQANWPDYVFEPTYELPSLASLEAFVKKNKHLPGMITAAEAADKGVDVGDTQAALLRKVEELTLYIIEQNKKIEALEQRMKQQEAKAK